MAVPAIPESTRWVDGVCKGVYDATNNDDDSSILECIRSKDKIKGQSLLITIHPSNFSYGVVHLWAFMLIFTYVIRS